MCARSFKGKPPFTLEEIKGKITEMMESKLKMFVNDTAFGFVETCAELVGLCASEQAPRNVKSYLLTEWMREWCHRFMHAFEYNRVLPGGALRLFARCCHQPYWMVFWKQEFG